VTGAATFCASEVACALEGRREGRQWRCRCPIHGGRSLMISNGHAGRLLVYCHGGCESSDVVTELRRIGFLTEGPLIRSTPIRHAETVLANGFALRLWRDARSPASTIVERYLMSRGIKIPPSQAVRFLPRCPHPSGATFPAMLGLVQHAQHGAVAVHRTFLKENGSAKAGVDPDKASLGAVSGGAVRLSPAEADQWLVVAEGIETALSVMQACHLPGWAALSAGGISKLVLPDSVSKVLICADNDANGVGQRAANAAAERFLSEGRKVRVALAPAPGVDFNDLLQGIGTARIAEAIHVSG